MIGFRAENLFFGTQNLIKEVRRIFKEYKYVLRPEWKANAVRDEHATISVTTHKRNELP